MTVAHLRYSLSRWQIPFFRGSEQHKARRNTRTYPNVVEFHSRWDNLIDVDVVAFLTRLSPEPFPRDVFSFFFCLVVIFIIGNSYFDFFVLFFLYPKSTSVNRYSGERKPCFLDRQNNEEKNSLILIPQYPCLPTR
jgi:hypothetical protein